MTNTLDPIFQALNGLSDDDMAGQAVVLVGAQVADPTLRLHQQEVAMRMIVRTASQADAIGLLLMGVMRIFQTASASTRKDVMARITQTLSRLEQDEQVTYDDLRPQ